MKKSIQISIKIKTFTDAFFIDSDESFQRNEKVFVLDMA